MTQPSASTNWEVIDRTGNPGDFTAYLDAVSSQSAIQAYKRWTFDLLNLRPGDRAIDVGCGTGDDAKAMARTVSPSGHVVGVDASEAMIEEAQRRVDDPTLKVEFHVGNALDLHFADGSFDGARIDRTLQHLGTPDRALAELVRVTRPGGRIVASEPDWGTLTLDSPDAATTQAVLSEVAGAIRNPWMGRQLFARFQNAGLTNVQTVPFTAVINDFAQAQQQVHFREGLNQVQAAGAVPADRAEGWVYALEEASAKGQFFASLSGFIAAGTRPR
jgi:ubiquinone/menaquinone biosynthesis C-methylase UbiE